jgi:hypothetical protein
MSTDPLNTAELDTEKVLSNLEESGFDLAHFGPFHIHADGRVAAMLKSGVHQVFERINDAIQWYNANSAPAPAESKSAGPA